MNGSRLSAVILATAAMCAGDVNAEPCFGSFFATTATVCGDAYSAGFTTGAVTPTANPILHMESGAAVSVGVVSAGPGAFGSASASGTFGLVHAFASANMDTAVTQSGITSAIERSSAYVGYIDGFDVAGTTPVTVHVTSSIEGGFSGVSQGDVSFMLVHDAQFLIYDEANAFVYENHASSIFERDLVLSPGQYIFEWAMRSLATAVYDNGSLVGSSIADISHTGRLNFDVLTSGASLTFWSGHDYGSVSDPGPGTVPEPSSIALIALGVAGLTVSRRRRLS